MHRHEDGWSKPPSQSTESFTWDIYATIMTPLPLRGYSDLGQMHRWKEGTHLQAQRSSYVLHLCCKRKLRSSSISAQKTFAKWISSASHPALNLTKTVCKDSLPHSSHEQMQSRPEAWMNTLMPSIFISCLWLWGRKKKKKKKVQHHNIC